MKQLSSFLLMLVLTGSFVLSKTHSPTTPIIPLFERPNEAGRNQELNILQGESLRIYLFCDQEHLNTEKVWCKEEPLKGCLLRTNPVIFSEPEWKVLTMASNQKVKLGDSRNSCASVHMTTVEVEDSGLFWFGLLHGQKINYLSPIKIVVHKGLSVPSTTDSSPTFRTPSFESSSKIEWKPVNVTVTQEQKNNGNMTVTNKNKPSIYHVVLVVGSTVTGILIITFITILLVMMFINCNVRESVGHVLIPQSLFSGRKSEELSQTKVTKDEVLDQ